MDVSIDFGTTNGKVGFFDGKGMEHKLGPIKKEELSKTLDQYRIENVIVSSVSHDPQELLSSIEAKGEKMVMSHKLKLPIEISYSTPHTLGTDRLAAIVGAGSRYTGKNILVIDAGTCITYDLLTDKGEYLGGGISPGLDLRFKAVHTYTTHLPLLSRVDTAELIGDSTKSSILSGVINGTLAEIREIIRMYRNKFTHLQLVICGGDAEYYGSHLPDEIDISPDLVLEGLKTVLDCNV